MSMDAQDVHSQVMDGDPDDTPVYCPRCHGEGTHEAKVHNGNFVEDVEVYCSDCNALGWVYKSEYEGDFPATRWP
jgi:DnaJ-class molecular chaperone